MPNPLENTMLLNYLNTLGQGLADSDNPMQSIGKANKQQIASANQMKLIQDSRDKGQSKLIQKLLASGGSIKQKDGKLNYTGDMTPFLSDFMNKEEESSLIGHGEGAFAPPSPSTTEINTDANAQDLRFKSLMQGILNASSSELGGISGNDLVGLTPENISQALQFKLANKNLEQSGFSNLLKLMALQQESSKPLPVTPKAPVSTSGISESELTLDQWNSLPKEDRSYFINAASKRLAGEEVPSMKEWRDENKATSGSDISLYAPVATPGISESRLKLKQWKTIPADDKSYYLYAADKKQKGEKALSKKEWEVDESGGTKIQYLKNLEKYPKLKKLAFDLAWANSPKIGEIAKRQIESGKGKGIAYVTGAKFLKDIRAEIAEDVEGARLEPHINRYMKENGLSYADAEARAIRRVIAEIAYERLQAAYDKFGKKVTEGDEGFEVDGEIVQRYPK